MCGIYGHTESAPRVLLAVTGSVAAIKVEELAAEFLRFAEVRVVLSTSAEKMLDLHSPAHREALARLGVETYVDADEWKGWRGKGDPVLHIELRRWANCLVFAPCSANTLAKLACGLSDNLATCVARAWDPQRPMVLAPAMNTFMWTHPATARHLAQVQADMPLTTVVNPVSKELACGDTGIGALAPPQEIAQAVQAAVAASIPAY